MYIFSLLNKNTWHFFLALKRLSSTVFGPRSLQETRGKFEQNFEKKRWCKIEEHPLPSYRHIARKSIDNKRICGGLSDQDRERPSLQGFSLGRNDDAVHYDLWPIAVQPEVLSVEQEDVVVNGDDYMACSSSSHSHSHRTKIRSI